jgi:protoporphyrinogen IX oxidase
MDIVWLKAIHISAVIVWCGVLLYLPLLLGTRVGGTDQTVVHGARRTLFRTVATPAALITIASGTLIFAWRGPLAGWLIAKLGLVSFLVLAHAVCGLLILRSEAQASLQLSTIPGKSLLAVSLTLLLAIAWLVLNKPHF